MSTEQTSAKKDAVFIVVLNWVLDNVVYGCIPLVCACIFTFLGKANIDLLKLTPDCLLVGFAISISTKSYIEEFDEVGISKERRRVFGAFPFITCLACCFLYAGLFGEYSAFSTLNEIRGLWFLILGLVIAVLVNIGLIVCLHVTKAKRMKD